MTTMNNVVNITNQPTQITMKVTTINGACFKFLLDVAPLSEEEINPALDCLVYGELVPRFNTPKIRDYIQEALDTAALVFTRFCFDNGEYDHFYAVEMISDVVQAGLCCEECGVRFLSDLHQLYGEYLAGSENAERYIEQYLFEFFQNTRPFVFDVA